MLKGKQEFLNTFDSGREVVNLYVLVAIIALCKTTCICK